MPLVIIGKLQAFNGKLDLKPHHLNTAALVMSLHSARDILKKWLLIIIRCFQLVIMVLNITFNGTTSTNTDHNLGSATVFGAKIFAVISGANYQASTAVSSFTCLADAEI